MTLHPDHPDFDPAMELLCMIPRDPLTASLSQLARDLGFYQQSEIQQLLTVLQGMGFKFHRGLDPKRGRTVCVRVNAWRRAEEAAEAYWAKVYENQAAGGSFFGGR